MGLAGGSVEQQQPVGGQARAERLKNQLPPAAQAPAAPAVVWTLDQQPSASSGSRHGAPVRQIQSAASAKRRSAASSPFYASGICRSTNISDTYWASSGLY